MRRSVRSLVPYGVHWTLPWLQGSPHTHSVPCRTWISILKTKRTTSNLGSICRGSFEPLPPQRKFYLWDLGLKILFRDLPDPPLKRSPVSVATTWQYRKCPSLLRGVKSTPMSPNPVYSIQVGSWGNREGYNFGFQHDFSFFIFCVGVGTGWDRSWGCYPCSFLFKVQTKKKEKRKEFFFFSFIYLI